MRGRHPGERHTPLPDYSPSGAWPIDDTDQTFGIDADDGKQREATGSNGKQREARDREATDTGHGFGTP